MPRSTRIKKTFVVQNEVGLHARPAALFAKTARGFSSKVTVARDEQISDGTSVLELLLLAAEKGCPLVITVEGEDATEAIDALEKIISGKY